MMNSRNWKVEVISQKPLSGPPVPLGQEFISDIYSKEFIISETTESTSFVSYFALQHNHQTLWQTLDFHIVNFFFMSSNIPFAQACDVYASQLIRYAGSSLSYIKLLSSHRALRQDFCHGVAKVIFWPTHLRNSEQKKNVHRMFDDIVMAELIKLAKVGVTHEAYHACSIQST